MMSAEHATSWLLPEGSLAHPKCEHAPDKILKTLGWSLRTIPKSYQFIPFIPGPCAIQSSLKRLCCAAKSPLLSVALLQHGSSIGQGLVARLGQVVV